MNGINTYNFTGIKKYLVTLLSAFTIFSCKSNEIPRAASMQSFLYKENGMERYGKSFYVKRNNDYAIVILDKDTPFEKNFKSDSTIFNDLQAIITKYRVYDYKKEYRSKVEISDGISWSIIISYDNNKWSISSHGENVWPPSGRAACKDISDYFLSRFGNNKN